MAAVLTHTISFRVTAGERRKLEQLRMTFPEPRWADTFRWLLEQEAVKKTIVDKIGDGLDEPERAGLDWSLPIGDR